MTGHARIRLLRALLPVALVVFLGLVIVSLRERPAAHPPTEAAVLSNGRSVKGFEGQWLDGARTALDARAGLLEERPGGGYHLEDVERLAIARTARGPLIVERARVADVEGAPGQRRIHVRDEVVVFDPQDGLRVTIPAIEVDEVLGVAESKGAVALEGETIRGSAEGVRYDLRDGPSVLTRPTFSDRNGGVVRADTALLHDGIRDLELAGSVSGERGAEHFAADSLRIWRDEDERPRRVEARGQVSARLRMGADGVVDASAASIDAEWDERGRPSVARLAGSATLARDVQSVAADRIDAVWDEDLSRYRVDASGSVFLRAEIAGAPAWLAADRIAGRADRVLRLESVRADGLVRFDSQGTRAEADSGTFEPSVHGGSIRLTAVEPRKARLTRDRTWVAAERITTDARGSSLLAEERVEATLLPATAAGPPGAPVAGLFRADASVSFVARTLRSEAQGARVFLREGVRGWQGERSLSADEVDLDQEARRLSARGKVSTRFPRDAERGAVATDDFVQVAAARLDYDERARRGVYGGRVHASFQEGWLEAEVVEVALAQAGGVTAIDARGGVRIEVRAAGSGSSDLHVGTGDRLEYRPEESTVRLFGDAAPASVRRVGSPSATTSGSVLRYRLDLGTLEVEPGSRAPARIRGG